MKNDQNDVPKFVGIAELLKGSAYALTIFTEAEVKALEVFEKGGKFYLPCVATDKLRLAKPEEIVRQLYLRKLMHHYGYPKERIAVEKSVYFGSAVHEKAADIVVWEKDAPSTPYIIVECKKPKRKDGLDQLKSYCNAEGSPIGVWTNGADTIWLHRQEPNTFRNLTDIPRADQKLADLLQERWTLADLTKHNKLVVQRTSLYRTSTSECRGHRLSATAASRSASEATAATSVRCLGRPRHAFVHRESLAARMSILSMLGGFANSSDAFSFRAAASLPVKCACRPDSSWNVS